MIDPVDFNYHQRMCREDKDIATMSHALRLAASEISLADPCAAASSQKETLP